MSLGPQSVEKLSRLGHTLHFDRGTYTHARYAQETNALTADHEIRHNGETIYSKRLGRNIQAGDVLPERLVLTVDQNGDVLGQNDFAERYQQYLREFHSDKTIEYEHVPNVLNYLLKRIDPSKSPTEGKVCYVDFDDDPLNAGKPKETGEWAPDGTRIDEWKRANPELAARIFTPPSSERDTKMEMLVELFRSGQIDADTFQSRSVAIFGGESVPAEEDGESADEPLAAASEHDAPVTDYETAPCGKNHKKGYLQQHQRFCKDPACQGKVE